MLEPTPELVERALAGDERAIRDLVDALTPAIQSRVVRALLRRRSGGHGRDVQQEVEDLTQTVFVALLQDEGRALRRWTPDRGLFESFVGAIAENEVYTLLRTRSRSPWAEEPVADDKLLVYADDSVGPERLSGSRELLGRVAARISSKLSDEGKELFYLLLVEQRPVEDVCELTGKNPDAVYAWKSRLARLARQIAAELLSENASPARNS